MRCCILRLTFLLWLFTFVNCEKVCNPQENGKKRCCINFKYVNGKCTECPGGSFGEDCTSQCPDGHYGVGCQGTCNCTDGQICDGHDGCVQNKTVDTMVIMETTSTEQQTTESNGYYQGILWNHRYGIPLGVVIIALVILLVHTYRKWKTSDDESESQHGQQTQEAMSPAVEINKNRENSVYDEICEFDTGCSHTHTLANSFNEISREKEVNQLQQKTSTVLHLDAITR